MKGLGLRVRYMHSDIATIQRMELIRDLRLGEFDVLVGINLLREGLDLPEVIHGGHSGRGQGGLPPQRDAASSRPSAGPPATQRDWWCCTPIPSPPP